MVVNLKRQTLLERIISLLSELRNKVDLSNSLGFKDINIAAESFFRGLLNRVYGYRLQDMNAIVENYPAIDLADKKKRIAIQITADPGSNKIKRTIAKFVEKGLHKDYDQLMILIIDNKKKYAKKFDTKGTFSFEAKKHIKDIKDLIRDVRALKIEKIEEIAAYIESELETAAKSKEKTVANEVETIMSLIEYLSDEKNLAIPEKKAEIDPEGKILKRFSDYSDFLIKEFQEHAAFFESKRIESENHLGLDPVKVKSIRSYLKSKSDALLTQCDGNPKKALHKLTDYFEQELRVHGKKHSYNAIRYYLVHQIIQCNVFPIYLS